jgi:hypothetical protein
MFGTAYLRYSHAYGWQVFDWMPGKPAYILAPEIRIHHHADGTAAIMKLTGDFKKAPIKRRFCKQPHKLVNGGLPYWSLPLREEWRRNRYSLHQPMLHQQLIEERIAA